MIILNIIPFHSLFVYIKRLFLFSFAFSINIYSLLLKMYISVDLCDKNSPLWWIPSILSLLSFLRLFLWILLILWLDMNSQRTQQRTRQRILCLSPHYIFRSLILLFYAFISITPINYNWFFITRRIQNRQPHNIINSFMLSLYWFFSFIEE